MDVKAAIIVSVIVTTLVIIGWMIWAVREYRRTGKLEWLWLGMLMLLSLGFGIVRWLSG